jgi:hypothetical protein
MFNSLINKTNKIDIPILTAGNYVFAIWTKTCTPYCII